MCFSPGFVVALGFLVTSANKPIGGTGSIRDVDSTASGCTQAQRRPFGHESHEAVYSPFVAPLVESL